MATAHAYLILDHSRYCTAGVSEFGEFEPHRERERERERERVYLPQTTMTRLNMLNIAV